MRSFLNNLDKADWDKHYQEHGARFPLNYDGPEDELNFLSSVVVLLKSESLGRLTGLTIWVNNRLSLQTVHDLSSSSSVYSPEY